MAVGALKAVSRVVVLGLWRDVNSVVSERTGLSTIKAGGGFLNSTYKEYIASGVMNSAKGIPNSETQDSERYA